MLPVAGATTMSTFVVAAPEFTWTKLAASKFAAPAPSLA